MLPRHEMCIAPHLIPECLLLLPAVHISVVGLNFDKEAALFYFRYRWRNLAAINSVTDF